jgi:CheY-like chemotaxis protein
MSRAAILVIDDDKHLVEMVQLYLEEKGYVVYTAQDGVHALPTAEARHPALIIMDVDMPVTDGLKALSQLRADKKTAGIPVILLTGVISSHVFPIIQDMPKVSHIKKPIQLEDLLSIVRHYVPNVD